VASTSRRGRAGHHEFVVVANRLPVDLVSGPGEEPRWTRSPGGLVTALEPVMQQHGGAWIGWNGASGEAPEPFDADGMHLVPVPLSAEEVADYYEGFSNGTLWPLYHDVIATPEYHREWWDAYVEVNERFAEAAAAEAAEGATVWVHDYQLQLVPAMLRRRRADLRIGFFNHIPFPPYEIFAQLPWRRQVVEGLLGADLLGFQREQDAGNLLRAARRAVRLGSVRNQITLDDGPERTPTRQVTARAYPISIDSAGLDELARTDSVRARAKQVRDELGSPRHVLLGVDRLDYTKGIMHRLKAFGELLDDGRLDPEETVLVMVATPSRERVEQYRRLKDEIELAVGRINGKHGSLGRVPVVYLHHSYPRDEMAAMFQAADVMLVTSLRDGMNLVAKEYVACRHDNRGVLVLSEFTGAAGELGQSLLINPHDIEGLKDAVMQAVGMDDKEQSRRMRSLRRRVLENDVNAWARRFLADLEDPA
jgi:alpha,alpha-trehalose-phosphate synthase [UDP-forming]